MGLSYSFVSMGVAAAMTMSAVAGSVEAPADRAAMPYFDELIELDVDPGMLAVFTEPVGGAEDRVDVEPALLEAGLDAFATQPSSVPGWTYVELAGEDVDAAAAVRRLADRGLVDMASLVYLGEGGLPVIPTRDLLVTFNDGVTPAEQTAVLAAHGAAIVDRDVSGLPGLVRARTASTTGAAMLDVVLDVHAHPAVAWAQSDRIVWFKRFAAPNDPLYPQQWALEQSNDQDMDAEGAWDVTFGDPSVRVVVLDSGMQQNHPDLNQASGQTFTGSGGNGGPSNACDNHGTAVAGCVSATVNNNEGIAGIAPEARSQSGKIFNEISFFGFCLGFLESQDSWIVDGITWSSNDGARVTNSSWGGGSPSSAITTAFNSTRAQGVLHFAAAGNDGSSTISYPASLGSVNAVAALNSSGTRAGFSTFGSGLFISAPGEAILSTDRTGGDGYENSDYVTINGTSFASPYAAGVAALVLSVDPALTPDEVEDILAQTAVDRGSPGYDTGYGWGFVNAAAAVAAVDVDDCPADLDASGGVDVTDLLTLLSAWGGSDGDVDGNGVTDTQDLLDLLAAWGPCP